jgi:hypothetical protein
MYKGRRWYTPIPRIQKRIISVKPAFEAPNERHEISVCSVLYMLPPGRSKAIPRIAGDHWFAIDEKLVRMAGELPDIGYRGISIARKGCEIK